MSTTEDDLKDNSRNAFKIQGEQNIMCQKQFVRFIAYVMFKSASSFQLPMYLCYIRLLYYRRDIKTLKKNLR